MKKKGKKRNGLEAAAGFFDVPAEVTGSARVTLTGRSRVLIENHHGILEYSAERVAVSCRHFTVLVQGEGLSLSAMNPKELIVIGRISAVFLDGEDATE